MNFIRSALFALFFYPGSVIAVLAAMAAIPFGPMAVRRASQRWAAYHRLCASHLLGIRTRIEGDLPDGPVLVASKHQSMYETIDLMVVLGDPAMVMKRELADVPGWGMIAQRYGIIPVDRKGGAVALRRMLRAAHEAIAEGRAMILFAEGTRVSPGEQPPLQSGFAGLYRALGVPVVPVALDSGLVWPRHRFIKRPGIVTMRFGEEIPPGLPRGEIEARVHAAINLLETVRLPQPVL